MSLYALYGNMHAAILEKDAAPAAGDVRRNPKMSPEAQLAVYINGYRLRLIEAVRADYPALLALLGEVAFDRMAMAYIERHPPAHFNLDRYPHGFAAFAAGTMPGDFAADLARLEGAIAEVFMQEDSEVLDPSGMRQLSPEAFGEMKLALRAASRLLALSWPAERYLAAWRAREAPPVPQPQAEYVFLVRHRNEVRRHLLGEAEYRVLAALAEGMAVGQALGAAASHDAALLPEIAGNLQRWFARWTESGFFRHPEKGI